MRIRLAALLALPSILCVPSFVGFEPDRAPAASSQESEELDPDEWEEALTHTFADGRVRAPENQGAMGTSALMPDLGKVAASVLVDRRHGAQVSIFLGWAVPEKYANEAHEDLRVRFVDVDGGTHVTRLYAGGGTALQFVSPADLELAALESFTLLHRKKAKWLKGK